MPPYIILDPLTAYLAGDRLTDLYRQACACRLLAICHEAAGDSETAERYRAEERAVNDAIALLGGASHEHTHNSQNGL